MSIVESEAKRTDLAETETVTVVTVDRETPWRPKSPFDVPRCPRAVGGVPIRRMPLAKLIEHNQEAMRTEGRFWWIATELLAGDRSGPADNAATGREGLGSRSAPPKLASPAATADSVDPARQPRESASGDDSGNSPETLILDRAQPRRHLPPGRTEGNGDGRRAAEVEATAADNAETTAAGSAPDDGDDNGSAGVPASPRGVVPPFRLIDQDGSEVPASITVHAATPLVAVEYFGYLAGREIVPEHDAVAVARRFRMTCPKAVTTIRPVHARRVVATVVVDVPEPSEEGGASC